MTATTNVNDAVVISVLPNDSDPDGDAISVVSATALSDPAAGTLVNNGDGTFTFTPDPAYDGTQVTFDYTITDGALQDTATVTISITDGEVIVNVPTTGGAGTSVDEAALASGSNAASTAETTTGTITYTAGDTPATVTIGGTTVTAAGQNIVEPSARRPLPALQKAHGLQLHAVSANDHSDEVADSDSFVVVVTDVDGDEADSTLTIDIANDGPTANDDGNSIAAGAHGLVSGNVVLENDVEGAMRRK